MSYQNRIVGHGEEPLDQIQFNPKNWRIHPGPQQEALEGVLSEVGFVQDVIVNKTTGNLIDGHLRCQVAARHGDKTIPVVYVELSQEEEDLILATIDPIAGLAATDKQKLESLLNESQNEDSRINKLLETIAKNEHVQFGEEQEAPEPQIDKADELRVKWGVELGQMWQLGEHRIICGDCTDRAVVERAKDIPLFMMVTDPPYGVDYDADWRNEAAAKGLLSYAARRTGKVENDTRDDWREAWELFDGNVIYCWHAGLRASNVQLSLESCDFEIRAQIIWAKKHFVIGRGHYTPRHEPCWYAVRKGKTANFIGDKLQTTLWDDISLDKNVEGGHSTQKPLLCMMRPIQNHEGGVYDPFLGSGTTLIACEQLHRKCRAIEISPAYVAVSIQRWVDMTGGTPVLLDTQVESR